MTKRAMLIILDGWGHGPDPAVNAIAQANTPFMDSLYKQYPNTELVTHGEDVGLPEGQMGNSEVGHLNIGAGRIVDQELARINNAIRERELYKNREFLAVLDYAKVNKKKLHLIGLVSDGGVHSHISHLKALSNICTDFGLQKVFIHAFTDGRDTAPESGAGFIQDLLEHIEGTPVQLASIVGRYYAMDRDKRWERIQLAYDLLVRGTGTKTIDPIEAIHKSYDKKITDEFIQPIVCTDKVGNPLARIEENDAVLFFNFRTDRPRQLTQVLTQQNMPEYNMFCLPLYFLTMTRYDDGFEDVKVLFEKENVHMPLGEYLSTLGKSQVRIAETEKYPHVTFFFSGGREAPFDGERRILIPSPKVATYDLQPEMSAIEIKDAIIKDMRENTADFICLNFANTDMVGHTGVFDAAIKAAETVDICLSDIIEVALEQEYATLIIADHGNSDYMINPDGTPHTAHTTNPVPCILVNDAGIQLKNGRLADVAPTLLAIMGLEQPELMTGTSLII